MSSGNRALFTLMYPKKKRQGAAMDALPDALVSLLIVPVVWDSAESGPAAVDAPPPVRRWLHPCCSRPILMACTSARSRIRARGSSPRGSLPPAPAANHSPYESRSARTSLLSSWSVCCHPRPFPGRSSCAWYLPSATTTSAVPRAGIALILSGRTQSSSALRASPGPPIPHGSWRWNRSAHPELNSDFLLGRRGSWPPGPASLSTVSAVRRFSPGALSAACFLSCFSYRSRALLRRHSRALLVSSVALPPQLVVRPTSHSA